MIKNNSPYHIYFFSESKNPKIIDELTKKEFFMEKDIKHCNLYVYKLPIDFFDFIFHFSNENEEISSSFKISEKDNYVVYLNKLIKIKKHEREKKCEYIIFSDMDGTLIGDEEATKSFYNYWLAEYFFDSRIILVFNTGRGYYFFLECLESGIVIKPEIFIG